MDNIIIMNNQENNLIYKTKNLEVVFGTEGGGFPTRLTSINTFSETTLINQQTAFMEIVLEDGRSASPFLPVDFKIIKEQTPLADKLIFPKIPWRDKERNLIDNFYLSLTYEFCADNTVFVDTFFFVEDVNAPNIESFKFEISLDFKEYDQINWATLLRPKREDFTLIMSDQNERMLPAGDNRNYPGEIIPLVNFNCKKSSGLSEFFEVFMEGHNPLSGKPENVFSAITWNDANPRVTWEFQAESTKRSKRPWQWRNHWGWVTASAPVKRRHAPMKISHYFDNYVRYPSNRQIDKMANEGADTLILHENWRLDAQNGGIPYDFEELARVRERAHFNNMKILLYVRGNENSASEDFCSWFEMLLEKNRDGLYIDYGSAICEDSAPTETFTGGRIHFRRHYMKLRKLRKTVGEEGLLILHTGPLFSAVGIANGILDGFITGEGEHGIMIRSREHNEYFSEAAVAPGTMWVAAFPGYGTEKVIPFLASSGQSAHMAVGIQFDSSSLTQPREPGINTRFIRPLWKLWGLFSHEKNISVFTDFNCKGIFSHKGMKQDKYNTGACLMISENRKTALLLLSNFCQKERECSTEIAWDKVGFNAAEKNCWQLSPTEKSPGEPVEYRETVFSSKITSNGVVGWFFNTDSTDFEKLEEYRKSYPVEDQFDFEYRQHIKNQRELRKNPVPADKLYLQVNIRNLAVPYEESLWWDLYNNVLQIGVFKDNAEFVPVVWISKEGLVANEPSRNSYIWPGDYSPWVALHDLLPAGKHSIGIRSLNNGSPFYSFIRAQLSPEPSCVPDAQELVFLSELEKDREFITFDIELHE